MVLNQHLVRSLSKTFKKVVKDEPRKLAYEVFSQVIRNGAYSNILLPTKLGSSGFDSRDKAFCTELVYGAIRQLGRNDFIIAKFVSKSWNEIDPEIIDILRLGAYQLFDMRIPTHAAVDATVNLARGVIGESKATFVNAIMRKLSTKELDDHLSEVQDDSISSLSVRFSHPEWIINSYRDCIPDIEEIKRLLRANNTPVAPNLVAWPTKSSQAELVELGATANKFSPFGAAFSGSPGDLAVIRERRAGVQDEGSQLLSEIFAKVARDHEPWLDLCAGPGGKAALLSFLAKNPLYCNELSPPRAELIKKIVRPDAVITVSDGRKYQTIPNQEVGAILADVPCTGLGALRRRPEIRWRRTLSDLASLTKLQFELAAHAINLLPEGGIFAYATCSPHIAEASSQCATIERKLPVVKIDVTEFMPNNLTGGVKNGYMQLWPHRHETDAMFLALYRKQ